MAKNSNWEVLTKNLVILKDKMGLTMKNYIFCGSLKNSTFRGTHKKPI